MSRFIDLMLKVFLYTKSTEIYFPALVRESRMMFLLKSELTTKFVQFKTFKKARDSRYYELFIVLHKT